MLAQLEVIHGPDKGRVFPLSEGQTLQIGRGPTTETRLTDRYVSRVHCQVAVEQESLTVTDLGGSGGTQVNGAPVAQQLLQHDDVITVGDTQLRVQLLDVHGDRTMLRATPRPSAATPKLPSHVSELTGATLAHYQVGALVAKGHCSLVFQATDLSNNEPVALKVLLPEYAQLDEQMQRFARSMKILQALRHPNLVSVLGSGQVGPFCWVAMEWVEGESLAQIIRKIGTCGILDWRHALRACVHVARALDFAQQHGIIHRNITPANILVRSSDRLTKLGDLMLAKALESAPDVQITRRGELVGELAYMSPERTYTSDGIDCRSDIYSLGATVYALLTGHPPCGGATQLETIQKIRAAEPAKPSKIQLSVPEMFEKAVLRMLAKQPEERQQTPAELLQELEQVAKYHGLHFN